MLLLMNFKTIHNNSVYRLIKTHFVSTDHILRLIEKILTQ